MSGHGVFPFGRKVQILRQEDPSPRPVFVLGVYASAVHARWIGADGKQRVAALAVASEPGIFWQGDGADSIISKIPVPPSTGKLVPAGERFNGPSGRSLDDRFLSPLGINRKDVWLCDIYPYAMVNARQRLAIRRKYAPIASKHNLPKASLEIAPTSSPGTSRIRQILSEVKASRAKTLILLGDRPIQWFLNAFEGGYSKLSDYGRTPSEYGRLHRVDLDGHELNVLPVVHPRQASRLGLSSESWGRIHDQWVRNRASSVL